MSNNELYEHKRSDTVKWVLTLFAFILVGVMLAGVILGWFDKKEEPPEEEEQTEQAAVTDGEGNAMDADMVYPMPAKMSFNAQTFAQFGEPNAVTSEQSVDVRIQAYVTPDDAANKEVDFSVAWGNAPTHGSEPVTNYLTVTPDSDGSTMATVSCKRRKSARLLRRSFIKRRRVTKGKNSFMPIFSTLCLARKAFPMPKPQPTR